MQIECKIRRAGGTDVPLGDTMIKFRPIEESGAHVADVKSKTHIGQLLAHPEAYAVYLPDEDEGEADEQPEPATALDPSPATAPDITSDDSAPDSDAEDDFADDGQDEIGADESEADDEGDAPGLTEQELTDMLDDPALVTIEDVDVATDANIDILYQAVIGQAPHPSAKPDTRRKKLVAAIEARDA